MKETDATPPASTHTAPLPPQAPIPSPRHTLPSPSASSSSSFSDPLSNPNNYSEISSNQRYIRSNELISQDGNIKYSFKAFDTQNGTEIVWQKVILSSLSEDEQRKITESANYLRAVRNQHILVYLDIWLTEHEPKTLNLITSYLDTLKQFIGKIGSLRWRIIKKWCKQILQ
jgi:WNK lysine deficient protein kinase